MGKAAAQPVREELAEGKRRRAARTWGSWGWSGERKTTTCGVSADIFLGPKKIAPSFGPERGLPGMGRSGIRGACWAVSHVYQNHEVRVYITSKNFS